MYPGYVEGKNFLTAEHQDIADILWAPRPVPVRQLPRRPPRQLLTPSRVPVFGSVMGAAWACAPAEDVLLIVASGTVAATVALKLPKKSWSDAPAARDRPLRYSVLPVTPWSCWEPPSSPQKGDAVMVAAGGERALWRVGEQYVFQYGDVWRPATVMAARSFLETNVR